jgi:hypothetical protein
MKFQILASCIILLSGIKCTNTLNSESASKIISNTHLDSKPYSIININKYSGDKKPGLILSKKSILTFFNLSKYALNKSLMNIDLDSNTLANIDNPNRQVLYHFVDQFNYYKTIVEPEIDSLKISKIDITNINSTVLFTENKEILKLDLTIFKSKDGLVLYNPGKKPIYFNMEKYKQVNIMSLIKEYFGK